MSLAPTVALPVIGLICIGLVNGASLDRPCFLELDQKSLLDRGLLDMSGQRNIEIPNGKTFRLDCSEQRDILRRFEVASLDLECSQGSLVTVERKIPVREGDIDCIRDTKPRSELIRNGTCYNNATKIDVVMGRNVNKPYVLYTVCHDEKTSVTLYSQSYINGKNISAGLHEAGNPRPPFRDTDIFPFDVNQVYKRESQHKDLANLLGSEDIVQKYIPSQQYYFSRGHLFPNGDPVWKFEKDATFYYINAVPQWQILNAGNWERLESTVRKLAGTLKSELKVWTGTHGVLQLNDVNNNPVDIWMHREEHNRLPVPKFMWKVVYDESEKAAVAVVQINNPWQKIITEKDLLCTDICEKIPWIRFDTSVVKKGYTYCCDVNDLKKAIEFVPSLNYNKLLNFEERSDTTSETDEEFDPDDQGEDEGYNSQESNSSSDSEEN